MSKKLWFRARAYGWGWTPCSWEGWTVLVAFLLFEWWNFMRLDAVSHSNSDTIRPFVIQFFLVVLILVAICYAKGEKPGWRWGNKKD